MVLSEEDTVGADSFEGAGLADELEGALMLRAALSLHLFLPFLIARRVLLEVLDNVDDPNILGNVLLDCLPDDNFSSALGADEDLAIGLDGEAVGNALLAIGVSALGDYSRSAVVDVELELAQRTRRDEAPSCQLRHSNSLLLYVIGITGKVCRRYKNKIGSESLLLGYYLMD